MPFATVAGVRLHYHTQGDAGPGLVFMHGYTGTLAGWRHQVDAFSGGYRILTLDHWGHGSSEAPGDASGYDVHQVACDVLELAAIAGLGRFHLVGHSLGGGVAQEVALRSPERLLSLTLADTTDWFGDHTRGSGPRPRRKLDEAERSRLAQMPAEALRATWDSLLRWRGTADRAHAIGVRTLIVHGERDALPIVEGSQRLAVLIPNARLVPIAGAGHDPHIEQPQQFNDTLSRFLAAD